MAWKKKKKLGRHIVGACMADDGWYNDGIGLTWKSYISEINTHTHMI